MHLAKSFAKRLRRLEPWCHRSLPASAWADALVAFIRFRNIHGRFPRFRRGSFNDALFWIKATGQLREPLRVETTDKHLVKAYIRRTLGEAWAVPTLAVLRDPQEVRDYAFPGQCVIKPTHTSGDIFLRRGGEALDLDRISGWLGRNYYAHGREANYRPLVPKVIVEPMLFDSDHLDDYKVFCLGGVPRLIQVDRGRHTDHRRCLYTPEWELLPYALAHPVAEPVPAPGNLREILQAAARLSAPFNLVRVDFYTDGTTAYVGELTHCHGNLDERFFTPEGEWDFAQRLFGPEGFRWPVFRAGGTPPPGGSALGPAPPGQR